MAVNATRGPFLTLRRTPHLYLLRLLLASSAFLPGGVPAPHHGIGKESSLSRIRRYSIRDIPVEKQVECGDISVCDSRTQYCDTVFMSCASCQRDVCDPRRYTLPGAEKDCKLYCPEYWETQQKMTTTMQTTTVAEDSEEWQAHSSTDSTETTFSATFGLTILSLLLVVSFVLNIVLGLLYVLSKKKKKVVPKEREADCDALLQDHSIKTLLEEIEEMLQKTVKNYCRPIPATAENQEAAHRHSDESRSRSATDDSPETESTALDSVPTSPQSSAAVQRRDLSTAHTDAQHARGSPEQHRIMYNGEPAPDPTFSKSS